MEVFKAYRYRLYPSKPQLAKVRAWGGCKRYVWNRLLAERTAAYQALGEKPEKAAKSSFNKDWSYVAMAKRVTQWRVELPWLKEAPVHALQNAAQQLMVAYKSWWAGRAEAPQFKKKGHGSDSWCETDRLQLDINGQAVKLPKLGWVRAKISRPFKGTIRSATVKQEGSEWYVSVQSKVVVDEAVNNGQSIGIDRGITHAMSGSDRLHRELPTQTPAEKRKLKKLAKNVTRKPKGSKNRAKAQRRLNKAKRRITRRVQNKRHVLTSAMAKNHSLVLVEDLAMKNMTASAAGTKEAPGKNVKAKSGLNRELLARGHYETERQLAYKCAWYGSKLVLVPPAYSSQECSRCGHVSAENRQTQDRFRCVACGYGDNADLNAAKVILKRGMAAGHAASACGEDVRHRLGHAASVRQEPTRGAQQCAV